MGKGGGGRERKAHLVLPAVAAGSLAALRPVGCAVGCERDERTEGERERGGGREREREGERERDKDSETERLKERKRDGERGSKAT